MNELMNNKRFNVLESKAQSVTKGVTNECTDEGES